MKKVFAFLVICILAGSLIGGKIGHSASSNKEVLSAKTERSSQSEQHSVAAVPTGKSEQLPSIDPATPVVVKIPKINVSATVEQVGMDSQGAMDIPKNEQNVAWYKLGYKPGQKGNAVIAGHFDRASGAPSVFYSLSKLEVGDSIISQDASGNELTFTVVRKENYPDDAFPLNLVFGPSDTEMLNLITCEGTWNKTTHNYSHRTVVFAQLQK